MGNHMSTRPPETSTTINFNDNLQLANELNSYEAACQVDQDLQSFDTSLHARTNQIINTLAVGVEVQALSFDSLREVTECLLEMNQEVVKVILKSKTDIWKNEGLFELVEEYFENSLQTLDFCVALERCLKRARDSQLLILVAVQQFEQEDGIDGNKYEKTLDELKKFRASGDPFTDEFMQIFQSVYRQQILMLNKLQHRKSKLDKKYKSIHAWRKVSGIIFAATFASVLICSVVAAAMASPPVAAALAAAVSNRIDGEDLDNIWVRVDRLEIEIESLLHNAELAVEEEAVKIGMEEIKKSVVVFMKYVDDLGKQADMCSREVRRARTVVLQRIIKHPGD
ncbi:transmembrane protein, putative [Actinidia rufa]|uniref:Transmembrane protein, putative n=1 Tax=Actinidia rufa TaxID=165716 RepID=A0A7J0ETI4_9ERIC|nr:transmembrane protein, putative [Actinidia rufa]